MANVKNVLMEAEILIYGDRESDYGHPSENMQTIADFWMVYLCKRGIISSDITSRDVAVMMALLKVARLGHDLDNRDSLVDAIGYLGLVERVSEFLDTSQSED